MKVHDSGMPEENYWKSLFDIPLIVDWLDLKSISDPIVEIGCGYGTFTVPIAKESRHTVYAFDIEPSMIENAKIKTEQAEVHNVQFIQRDILEQGTGLESGCAALVLLFNILHFTERRKMLEEGCRILKPSGVLAIIHWRKDIETPRGPDLSLRPDQPMILDSIAGLDVLFTGNSKLLEPYHWGMQFIKRPKI
jgi:ubiquinone/menaquinone biosynthesis C-methylase UbiE